MSPQRLEAFLAQLYVDELARQRFLDNPRGAAMDAGLSEADCIALETIDLVGLELASDSYAKKRAGRIINSLPYRLSQWFRRNCFCARNGLSRQIIEGSERRS
ncbi:MAG: hypothetical protein EXR70_09185 [Deltaproteobacteria bacterium]|nr:hypothetical protein [Deltaproteobacteria bacterium]